MSKKKNKKQKAVYHITVGTIDHVPSKQQLKAIAEAFKEAQPSSKFIATDASVNVVRLS